MNVKWGLKLLVSTIMAAAFGYVRLKPGFSSKYLLYCATPGLAWIFQTRTKPVLCLICLGCNCVYKASISVAAVLIFVLEDWVLLGSHSSVVLCIGREYQPEHPLLHIGALSLMVEVVPGKFCMVLSWINNGDFHANLAIESKVGGADIGDCKCCSVWVREESSSVPIFSIIYLLNLVLVPFGVVLESGWHQN